MKLIIQDDRIAGTATDDYAGPDAWLAAPEDYDPAKAYRVEDGVLVEVVPQVVSRRQAKQALLQAGLLDDVDAAIAAGSDRSAQIDWADAQEFSRDWPALIALQPALGLTDAQIDDLFRLAATL